MGLPLDTRRTKVGGGQIERDAHDNTFEHHLPKGMEVKVAEAAVKIIDGHGRVDGVGVMGIWGIDKGGWMHPVQSADEENST